MRHVYANLARAARTAAAGLLLAGLGACAVNEGANIPDPIAANPQPTGLQQGLAVKYYGYDIEDVGYLERLTRQVQGAPGAPLAKLDFAERSGNVLTSASRNLIGADITGFIKFPQSGRYGIVGNSNDGIRIFIGGKRVTENPGAHPMERTPVGEITVDGDTWYPLRVLYFQRAGSWGIELLWAPAGQPLTVVPETALARPQ